jgi:hypothetical protein
MSEQGVCRVGDSVEGTCYLHTSPVNFTGVWSAKASDDVVSNDRSVIVRGDVGDSSCGHVFYAQGGLESDVIANNLILQRINDIVYINNNSGDGVGRSATGSSDVTSF